VEAAGTLGGVSVFYYSFYKKGGAPDEKGILNGLTSPKKAGTPGNGNDKRVNVPEKWEAIQER
jgi:hypothetical protein